MANPTMPELPNQIQRSIPALNGIGFPRKIQLVIPNNKMATKSLRRLATSGPYFLLALVKNIEEAEKHTAVTRAAISPMLGVMRAHELFRCGVTRLSNPFPAQYFYHGDQENFEIQPERPMINIPDIQFKFFFPSQRISPVYLRPAGDPWQYSMPTGLFWGISLQVLH